MPTRLIAGGVGVEPARQLEDQHAMVITQSEARQVDQELARVRRDLDQAKDMLELHNAAMTAEAEGWRQESNWRKRSRLAADVDAAGRRIARLEQLAAMDPEPDPAPDPPAATRFPIAIARWQSTCPLSGKTIHPNDVICSYRGAWVLYSEAVADDDQQRREGLARKAVAA